MSKSYYNQKNMDNTVKLRNVFKTMPLFVEEFFVGIEQVTTPLTRLNYSYDLRIFFDYLSKQYYSDMPLKNFTLADIDKITSTQIESFLSYLSFYKYDNKEYSCNEKAKSRKLSTLRTFFKYYFNKDKLTANVAAKVKMPKIHDKGIIRLEVDEIARLIELADTGAELTPHEQSYHKNTRTRDIALLTLFLGTGIRISECIGLNIEDIDFNVNGFNVTRKGGSETVLYFSEEVATALKTYILERQSTESENETEEPALFLSLQKKRMSIRAVQNLVKKYSKIITPLKKITPHKLRSTYGTALYAETKDIYIVADVLGHKDINTTKKHYAAISDDMRRNVAGKVKLRKDD